MTQTKVTLDGRVLNSLERVINSISYLIKECSSKLKINDNNMELALEKITQIDRLLPQIHYYHHSLQHSMRQQNSELAAEELHKLVDLICHYVPANEWISIAPISNSEWENFVIPEAIRLTEESSGNKARIEIPTTEEFASGKDWVSAALASIARNDPDMYDEVLEHVRFVKLFRGQVTMGFTDVRILGAMLIRLPRENVNPVLYFFEHIIHEASHIHLNCLMVDDPLILNLPTERYISPLRPDPRPMLGVFHATFVSARIARSFLKLFYATQDKHLLHPLAEVIDETLRGIIEIKKNAILTEQGSRLVNNMQKECDLAKALSCWVDYEFNTPMMHRFGAGETKLTTFREFICA